MTPLRAYFKGGPLNGESRVLERAMPTYEVPLLTSFAWSDGGLDVHTVVYRLSNRARQVPWEVTYVVERVRCPHE